MTYERALAGARAQLCDEAFALAKGEGQALTLKQAIAYALEASDIDPPSSVATAIPQ
jgi:hypothetical protein